MHYIYKLCKHQNFALNLFERQMITLKSIRESYKETSNSFSKDSCTLLWIYLDKIHLITICIIRCNKYAK